MLIQLNKQNRDAQNAGTGEGNVPLPARPTVINYYSPIDPDRLEQEGAVSFVPDELVAVAAEGAAYTDMERFFGEREIRIVGYVELTDTYQLRLKEPLSLFALTRAAAELEAEPAVDCAAVNVAWQPAGCALPEDPWDESADWNEARRDASNWGLMAIRAPESWEAFDPGTVRVGLIDSAFDPSHEDLRYAALRSNESYTRRDPSAPELWKHGTAVAGVIGAVHDNGRGLSGVLKDCRFYAFGSELYCGQADALSAMAELAMQDVNVVQYGLGWREELLEALQDENSRAYRYYIGDPARIAGCGLKRLLQKGYDFLLVLPAGNGLDGDGAEVRFNSILSSVREETVQAHILTVGAAGWEEDGSLRESPFSSRGSAADLLAPGEEIYTAQPKGKYALLDGSSLAAAHVTGVCAGAWALNPGLSGARLRELMIDTARKTDPESGPGLLDMYAALEEAARGAGDLPILSERERALDAYAALLRNGVQLRLRGISGIAETQAQYYRLLDMDGDGVEELLLYVLDERELAASFAIYGCREGTAVLLADAWNTCRFSSWSNMSLTLEIWDGSCLYAAAEKSSSGYGETGERFWLHFDGEELLCEEGDLRPQEGESIPLIEGSVLTEEGVRIGSARDLLREH